MGGANVRVPKCYAKLDPVFQIELTICAELVRDLVKQVEGSMSVVLAPSATDDGAMAHNRVALLCCKLAQDVSRHVEGLGIDRKAWWWALGLRLNPGALRMVKDKVKPETFLLGFKRTCTVLRKAAEKARSFSKDLAKKRRFDPKKLRAPVTV